MINFELLHPRMTYEMLGMLPEFLSEHNPAPAKEQLDHNYKHGGGWKPFNGFKLCNNNSLIYPGDPPLKPLAQAKLHNELVVFYDCSWVAIIQLDRSFEVCRMD